MNLKPLHDRVVVKRIEVENKTASGIILPDTNKQPGVEGVVVAVGPDVKEAKVGDKIIFGKYCGSEVKTGDESFLVMKESEVLAVIE